MKEYEGRTITDEKEQSICASTVLCILRSACAGPSPGSRTLAALAWNRKLRWRFRLLGKVAWIAQNSQITYGLLFFWFSISVKAWKTRIYRSISPRNLLLCIYIWYFFFRRNTGCRSGCLFCCGRRGSFWRFLRGFHRRGRLWRLCSRSFGRLFSELWQIDRCVQERTGSSV